MMQNITTREKFLKVFKFDTSLPVLNWEFGNWFNAVDRWYSEGLPKKNPVDFNNSLKKNHFNVSGCSFDKN